MSRLETFWRDVNRRKKIDAVAMSKTPLNRCLSTFDLTLLGISQMVGAGIFVLTGTVAKNIAGPGVMLSYLFAGFGCFLSALCYAEFAARVPLAGSAYSYCYVTVGEIWAFIIGWNMLLEYIIGVSSTASALSGTIDSLSGYGLRNFTASHIGTMGPGGGLSEVPDFLAFFLVLIMAVFVALGTNMSAKLNNVLNILTTVGIIFITILAFAHADIDNWKNVDHGGFLPFGMKGVAGGAATCFFAYVGFDAVAVASEEAKTPQRSMPIAITVSIGVAALLYFLASCSLSLLVPYYEIDPNAPFPMAFAFKGITWAKYAVGVVSGLGIVTATLSSLFAMPRGIYAMASDGLVFKFLAHVHPKTQTPLICIIIFSILAAFLALLFDIETLVELLSIGTLFAYTMVSACVILLRYLPTEDFSNMENETAFSSEMKDAETIDEADVEVMANTTLDEKADTAPIKPGATDHGTLKYAVKSLPVLRNMKPGKACAVATIFMAIFMAVLCALLWFATDAILKAAWWAVLLIIVLAILIVFCLLVLYAHVQNTSFETFKVPWVPFIPATSIMFNVLLMLKLSYQTWIRVAIWMVVGFIIYFAYGMGHSKEGTKPLATPTINYGASGSESTETVSVLQQPPQEVTGTDDPNGPALKDHLRILRPMRHMD